MFPTLLRAFTIMTYNVGNGLAHPRRLAAALRLVMSDEWRGPTHHSVLIPHHWRAGRTPAPESDA